jgi:hypothetical protein
VETQKLGEMNRLEMIDFQRSRVVATQASRSSQVETAIGKRSFTTSPSRIRLGRDAGGNLIGSGILINRRS